MTARHFNPMARFLAMLLAWVLIGNPALAVEDPFFQVLLPVEDQSDEARNKAVSQGFQSLVIKSAGSASILNTPALIQARRTPTRYLRQFAYVSGPQGETLLRLQFEGSAITRLLSDSGAQFWPQPRQSTVVWLAVEPVYGDRYLVNEGTDPMLAEPLTQAAAQRGVPITLPLLDLQESRSVRPVDVWGLFTQRLLDASRRYDIQTVLAGRMVQEDEDAWRVVWLLDDGEVSERFEAAGTLEQVMQVSMGNLAESMTERHAVRFGAELRDAIVLEVSEVLGLQAFAEVNEYLSGLLPVRRLMLQSVDDDRLRFQLVVDGGAEALQQMIQRDDRLQEQRMPVNIEVGDFDSTDLTDLATGQASMMPVDAANGAAELEPVAQVAVNEPGSLTEGAATALSPLLAGETLAGETLSGEIKESTDGQASYRQTLYYRWR